MANKIPLKAIYTGADTTALGEFTSSDTIASSYLNLSNSIGASELNVVDNGTSGQVLTSDGDGTFSWSTPQEGDITGVTAGTGISGGGTAGTVTINLDTSADQAWTGSQRATLVVDNDGSFDMDLGQNFKCTPTGTFALTFTNITNGQSGFIWLVNTAGVTITKPATTLADSTFLSTVSTAGTYLISYIADGTNVIVTNSAAVT